jgi:hypothetical protein
MGRNEFTDKSGRKFTVLYASNKEIRKHEDLAVEFFEKVLGEDYGRFYISDQSSLLHMRASEEDDGVDKMVIEKIREVYGVDISDIEDANFVRIFERIEAARAGSYVM